MRNIICIVFAVVTILLTSCEKEQFTPAKSNLKSQPIECRKCTETWDITEPVPPTNP